MLDFIALSYAIGRKVPIASLTAWALLSKYVPSYVSPDFLF